MTLFWLITGVLLIVAFAKIYNWYLRIKQKEGEVEESPEKEFNYADYDYDDD